MKSRETRSGGKTIATWVMAAHRSPARREVRVKPGTRRSLPGFSLTPGPAPWSRCPAHGGLETVDRSTPVRVALLPRARAGAALAACLAARRPRLGAAGPG